MIGDQDDASQGALWATIGIVAAALFGLALLAFALFLAEPAPARTLYPGQWAQVDPEIRRWFNNQIVPAGPAKGASCCSEADGVYAEEDLRNGHYWTRFQWKKWDSDSTQYAPADSEWMEVPDDTVIHDPNRHGAPVVWWWVVGNKLTIRCFAPGALF